MLFRSVLSSIMKISAHGAPLPTVPIGIKITNPLAPAVVVELFQDVCCPYSKKMFDTVFQSLIPILEKEALIGNVQFLWQSVPQPWHAQSCCMHDAVMAASILDVEKTANYILNIFDKQTDFFDDRAVFGDVLQYLGTNHLVKRFIGER